LKPALPAHNEHGSWLGHGEARRIQTGGRLQAVLPACSFASEECGLYTVAEACGREALALDPGDLWATFAPLT
jgi:hypothetical protein